MTKKNKTIKKAILCSYPKGSNKLCTTIDSKPNDLYKSLPASKFKIKCNKIKACRFFVKLAKAGVNERTGVQINTLTGPSGRIYNRLFTNYYT